MVIITCELLGNKVFRCFFSKFISLSWYKKLCLSKVRWCMALVIKGETYTFVAPCNSLENLFVLAIHLKIYWCLQFIWKFIAACNLFENLLVLSIHLKIYWCLQFIWKFIGVCNSFENLLVHAIHLKIYWCCKSFENLLVLQIIWKFIGAAIHLKIYWHSKRWFSHCVYLLYI